MLNNNFSDRNSQNFYIFFNTFFQITVLADDVIETTEGPTGRDTFQNFTLHDMVELKYFFSSHVSTENGGECSSTAIRSLIKKLVSSELPAKPLSDRKITDLLADQGIQVARRTIAKYRESLGIPPSNQRKSLL